MTSEEEKNNSFKVGIIGTGFGSVVQYPGFKNHSGFNPVTIVGKHKSKTKKIANNLGAPNYSTSWKDVIQDDKIDVISVATPPNLHHEISIAALEAGKHVLCEKPLTTKLKYAEEMVSVAGESGSVSMVDLVFRYIPSRAYMVELIKNGYLGEIYQFDIKVTNSSRLNPRAKGYNWWSDLSEGGGVLNALGSHYLDFLLQIFEQIGGVCGKTAINLPKRLNKMTGRMKKVTSDDAFSCYLDVGENILASIKISTTSAFGRGSRIEAYGSEGAIIMQEDQKLIGGKLGEDENLKYLKIPKRHQLLKTIDGQHFLISPFMKLLDDFQKSISTGQSLHPNFKDGLKIQQLLQAIRLSDKKDRWVDIE